MEVNETLKSYKLIINIKVYKIDGVRLQIHK